MQFCIMKRLVTLLISMIVYHISHSQAIKYITFAGGSDLSSISFVTDQKIILKISQDGKMIEFGNDLEPGRFYSRPGQLQKYMGRVEYYERQFDSTINGKLKSVGTTTITYYGAQENAALVGKIKSIGTVWFDYYSDFENEGVRGKLKAAGQKTFTYYTSFENEAYKGKLKSVGGIQISYYSTFDDKLVRGKLKSIGSSNYVWYTSMETSRYLSGLKSGSIYQNVDGIMYIIW